MLNYNSYYEEDCDRNFILKYKDAVQWNMNRIKMDELSIVPQYKKMLVHCFNNMNYQKLYNQLINRSRNERRQRDNGVYYENHHIKPRCIGGTNEENNLVLLTAREHFIAHWILTRIYPNNSSIIFAFNCFNRKLKGATNQSGQLDIYSTSKNYEYARKKVITLLKSDKHPSKEFNKIHFKNKIFINNGNTCKRILIKDLIKYLEQGWNKGRLPFKRKQKVKKEIIRNSNPNYWCPEERREKLRKANLRNPHCWISKGEDSKQIFVSELNEYLQDGWIAGMRRAFNSTNVFRYLLQKNYKIRIRVEYLSSYVDAGWKEVSWEEFQKSSNKEI